MPDVTLTTDTPVRVFVRLRMTMPASEASARALGLPVEPLTSRAGEPTALWIAPDQWLLTGTNTTASELIDRIEHSLGDVVHHATDASDALVCFLLSGRDARGLLAMGSSVDFDERAFPVGNCTRTRVAKIAVVVHCFAPDRFELIFDRSVAHYLEHWLQRAMADAAAWLDGVTAASKREISSENAYKE